METADGFVVIARQIAAGSVVPPYRYTYWHETAVSLNEAADHYADLERGEYRNWQPVAIVPCKAGVPLGSTPLGPFTLARLVKETNDA